MTRLRLTRIQVLAAVNRIAGYAVAGYVSSLVAGQHEHAIAVGLRTGATLGVMTVIAGSLVPFVEWEADHVPARWMGVFGVGLILIGFALNRFSIGFWM